MSKITFEINMDNLPENLYWEVRAHALKHHLANDIYFHPQKDGTIKIASTGVNREYIEIIIFDFINEAKLEIDKEDLDEDSIKNLPKILNNYLAIKDNLAKAINILEKTIEYLNMSIPNLTPEKIMGE